MRKSILGTLATSAMVAVAGIGARPPQVGEKAPEFEVATTRGPVRLSEYAGSKLVLAFYFADFTPG